MGLNQPAAGDHDSTQHGSQRKSSSAGPNHATVVVVLMTKPRVIFGLLNATTATKRDIQQL